MASPFIEDPIEEGAQIVRRALRRERIFLDRSNPLDFADDYLYERYRFSRPGLEYICQILEPHIGRATRRSAALTVPQSVCIAMRFFTTGSYLYTVGDAERLSKNTVCRVVHQVASALTSLMDDFIVFPGHLPAHVIKQQFYAIAGFPRVLGCIDSTLIPISAPLGEDERDYIDQYNSRSLNVQMTCDHTGIITSLDAKWPGSVHDSRVFRESTLHHRLQQGHFSGVLLGDRGYALHPFLMTPYPDPEPGPQTRYNLAHNRTRVKIENSFSLLKARFASLRCLRVAPDRACKIIAACCVLHNIATIRKERAPCFNLQPLDVVDPINLEYPTGRAVREAITSEFFT
ncbi:putative nuclease HARBI1 [Myripristis murdjan]|uniref:putative nuclease HARBI1 n=1 Tax=Myripristis murdjan TaxID=586833 RepID=UPI001175CB96|nr:putative nuclease HARBI1 [Myripristis murdjan]